MDQWDKRCMKVQKVLAGLVEIGQRVGRQLEFSNFMLIWLLCSLATDTLDIYESKVNLGSKF